MAPNENTDGERLVRLETKLDNITDLLKDKHAAIEAKHADYDERLKSLETWVNRMFGGLIVIDIVFAFFSDKLKGLFS